MKSTTDKAIANISPINTLIIFLSLLYFQTIGIVINGVAGMEYHSICAKISRAFPFIIA